MKKKLINSLVILVILCVALIHSCKKEPSLPVVTTQDVFDVTYTTATSGGNVTNDGGASIESRGLCWNTSPDPTTANDISIGGIGVGPFRKSITNLTAGTKYYLRAYATNSAGTGYGNEESFITTPIELPVLTTYPITFLTQTNVKTGGQITAFNGGYVSARGVCWGTTPNPTIELSTRTSENLMYHNFYSNISGLIPGTTYYVRAYATNETGTAYGNEITFTVHIEGTSITDIDGNVYNTVTIGSQIWMAENLRTTRFNNGTPIDNVTNSYWESYHPAYCWYRNDEAGYKSSYGALYNWDVVNQAYGTNVCPAGWHVPTDAEWTELTTYLGGELVAGGKLKEAGTAHWLGPNIDATNESGFTALPGGSSNFNWVFDIIGLSGNWWCSNYTAYNMAYHTLIRSMVSSSGNILRTPGDSRDGYSVRCLRDY